MNTRAPGIERTPPGGTSAPAGQAQGGPSPVFMKENIDVLRTMIKELDNQEEVRGYSSDGSSRSRSRGRPRSARKHQKSVSGKKGTSKSHRSVRSDARSRSKSKSVRSKPQSVRASRRKSSLDSGYDTVSDNGLEDLSMPYRQPKPMPFTSRITRFRYQWRAKLLLNVWLYEGNKDPEDHLSIFSAVAEQKEWPMPVWCTMFRQTLSGSARNWFDSLDPKSVDGFKELSNKFLEEFSQQKRYDKDTMEIHGIKQKPNEVLQAFMDCFKAESTQIKGVSSVLRISAFIHGHDHPELAKKLNDKILKTVDEMWDKVRAFIKRETAADTIEVIRSPREGFTPLTKTSKEILAMDNMNFPPPPLMVGTSEKRNMNKFCDYHQDRGHNTNDCYHLRKQIEEAVASRRLAHLKRPYERVKHWMDNAIAFPLVPQYQLMDCPVVVDALIEGFRVRRIHVDGGSSSEVMYEHCFKNLSYRTRLRLKESRVPLVGFSRVVKSPSPYNALLSRTWMRSLGAVASTIHSMIKFLTLNGIATIATTRETLRECRQIEEAQALSRHARVIDPTLMRTSSEVANPRVLLALMETRSWRPRKEPMQLDDMEERQQLDKWKKPPKFSVKEKIVVNDDYPEQLVTIGGGLSAECRHALILTLRKNVDIFAWTPADMTGIPR
ncbi:reverse transcriptase domain-containing protein [Tanacetum coccineum]